MQTGKVGSNRGPLEEARGAGLFGPSLAVESRPVVAEVAVLSFVLIEIAADAVKDQLRLVTLDNGIVPVSQHGNQSRFREQGSILVGTMA